MSIRLKRFLFTTIIGACFAVGIQAQSIRFESSDGQLKVNGNILHSDDIPIDMNLEKTHFSIQMMGGFPMRISINGMIYEIWADRITEGNRIDEAHFRLFIDQDGTFLSVESSAAGDSFGLTDTMADQIENFVSATTEWRTWNDVDDPTSLMHFGHGAMQQNAKRMLELSSYFTHVRDASSELFELLRDEWSKEQEAMEMAKNIHHLEPGPEREKAVEDLEEKLDEIFSMKQTNRQMEIRHLEVELNRLEERLRERSEAKERLIDARLSELLDKTYSLHDHQMK